MFIADLGPFLSSDGFVFQTRRPQVFDAIFGGAGTRGLLGSPWGRTMKVISLFCLFRWGAFSEVLYARVGVIQQSKSVLALSRDTNACRRPEW